MHAHTSKQRSSPLQPPDPAPALHRQGFDVAKKALLEFLDNFKEPADASDRELLRCVARTSLRTKLHEAMADQLTDIVTDAVLTIRNSEQPMDLHMVGGRAPPAQAAAGAARPGAVRRRCRAHRRS
jgi:hypothetical protein